MKNRLTVLVTGAGGGGIGEQLMKTLRLSKTDYRIVASDISPASTGLMEADVPCIVPRASDPDYVSVLLSLCRKHGVRALFPGSEPELKAICREKARFESAGVFLPINPANVIDVCLDKSKTMVGLANLGFSFPETLVISTPEEAERISFLPAVLKPSVGGSGSANVLIAQTRDEAVALGKYLLTLYPSFIAQEYVGTADSEYTVGVMISMDGKLINSIAVKRDILAGLSNRIRVPNRTGRRDLGPVLAISSGISQGLVGRFPVVTRPCEEIALAFGCRSVFNIQCRLVGKKVFVFEINPRYSGTAPLRAMMGYNEPDTLIRLHLFGERIRTHFVYKSGLIMRALREIIISKPRRERGIPGGGRMGNQRKGRL